MSRKRTPASSGRAPVRVASAEYPIGTRIAEGYGMDLNREAAEGLPAEDFGRRTAAPAEARARVAMGVAGTLLVAAVFALLWLRAHPRAAPAAVGPAGAAYADVRAAIAGGAYAAGWVPSFVPATATSLRVWSDPATQEVWLGYAFEPAAERRMAARFERTQARLEPAGQAPAWWPGRAGLAGLEIWWTGRIMPGGRRELVAIDWKHSRAWVWRE